MEERSQHPQVLVVLLSVPFSMPPMNSSMPHDRIHPVRQLSKPAGFLFRNAFVVFFGILLLRTSPLDVIPILLEAPSRLSPRTPVAPVPVVEQALVGDIVLRYHYPEYTGLSVLEVANSRWHHMVQWAPKSIFGLELRRYSKKPNLNSVVNLPYRLRWKVDEIFRVNSSLSNL